LIPPNGLYREASEKTMYLYHGKEGANGVRKPNVVKPKTDFGIEVRVFTAKHGMTIKELANLSGVKYKSLIAATTGQLAGHELIPTVHEFMDHYDEAVVDL